MRQRSYLELHVQLHGQHVAHRQEHGLPIQRQLELRGLPIASSSPHAENQVQVREVLLRRRLPATHKQRGILGTLILPSQIRLT